MVVPGIGTVEEINQAVQQEDPETLYQLVTSLDWDELPSDELNAALRTIAIYGYSGRTRRYGSSIDHIVTAIDRIDLGTCALLELNDQAKLLVRRDESLVRNKDADGRTPLHDAAERGNAVLVEEFCECGALLDEPDGRGHTPLDLAMHAGPWKTGASETCVEILLAHGAAMDAWRAAAIGDVSRLRDLMAKDEVGVNDMNELGRSMLYEAAHNNHLEVVAGLLDSGADPNVTNSDGQTPLSTACLHSLSQECDVELIEALLNAGAIPTIESSIIVQDLAMLNELLNARVELLSGQEHQSVLGYAIHTGKPRSLSFLIQQGARPDTENWGHIERIFGGDSSFVAELKNMASQ